MTLCPSGALQLGLRVVVPRYRCVALILSPRPQSFLAWVTLPNDLRSLSATDDLLSPVGVLAALHARLYVACCQAPSVRKAPSWHAGGAMPTEPVLCTATCKGIRI